MFNLYVSRESWVSYYYIDMLIEIACEGYDDYDMMKFMFGDGQ